MRRPLRDREAVVFTAASALALVHALDDAFVHRGPGLGLGQHALAGAIAVFAWLAGVLAFPRLRPGLRAALAFAYGGLAPPNRAVHAIHLARHRVGGGGGPGGLAPGAGGGFLRAAGPAP